MFTWLNSPFNSFHAENFQKSRLLCFDYSFQNILRVEPSGCQLGSCIGSPFWDQIVYKYYELNRHYLFLCVQVKLSRFVFGKKKNDFLVINMDYFFTLMTCL